jgi:hypothetical protein
MMKTTITLLGALLLGGCTMSLEAARSEGIAKQAHALPSETAKANPEQPEFAPAKSASRTECQHIDSVQLWWGISATFSAPIAATAIAASGIKSFGDTVQATLLIGGLAVGAWSALSVAEQNSFANLWAKECSLPVVP